MSKILMRRAVAIGAACFVLIGAMSMAEAGRGGGGFKGRRRPYRRQRLQRRQYPRGRR